MNGIGQTGFGALAIMIAAIALADPSVADGQVEGALQYPPPSIGEDAQPPLPARMAPKIVAPRRLELGAHWSSLALRNRPYEIYAGGNRAFAQPAPTGDALPVPLLLPMERESN